MVRQFFHRAGPRIARVFDRAVRAFGGGSVGAGAFVPPAIRNTLGQDHTHRYIGSD